MTFLCTLATKWAKISSIYSKITKLHPMFRDFSAKPYPMFRDFLRKSHPFQRHTPVHHIRRVPPPRAMHAWSFFSWTLHFQSTSPPPRVACTVYVLHNNIQRKDFNQWQNKKYGKRLKDMSKCIIQGGPKITERHTSGNKDIKWLVSVDGLSSPEQNDTKISQFG